MDSKVHLDVKAVDLMIGGFRILNDISFQTRRGELLALIGPNGAGKTSLLNCVSGIYQASGGSILFEGKDLVGKKPHRIAKIGITRTFQHAELFRHMNVLDNLLVGRQIMMKCGLLSNGIFWGKTIKEEITHRQVVEEVIEFLELEKYRKSDASGLADEPSAGMNRQEKEDLARFILRIKYEIGITMIWVEHDMQLVGDLADRIVVLNFGTKLAEGESASVLRDSRVIEAYLGTGGSQQVQV
ncbi:MAG: ATP-binding cassette domain-containing protein [Deltaproteobacteria bacterium]|nr:ATP-binding cassette domain-containing protein [Deltaproteobacteria bacterium]